MQKTSANNALAKVRAGHWNLYSNDMAAVVRGLTHTNGLFINFNITILKNIYCGLDQQ
jgi:hypothetical protein